MNRLTRDGTAEPVSRDQFLRHVREQGNIHSPCLADHEQDWQPYYPVDPYSPICDDHTYIHTYIQNIYIYRYIHTYIQVSGNPTMNTLRLRRGGGIASSSFVFYLY